MKFARGGVSASEVADPRRAILTGGVSATPTFNTLTRPALAGEFVPADYFREVERAQLCRGERPLEIDLGCGDGSFLMGMAKKFPERDFLGVERLLGRVRKVCRKITRQSLGNAKVLRLDSRYVVEWLLPEATVSRLHLLCPDPWPKLRHHRRRLVQTEFLSAVRRALIPGGEFLFMTDHEEYFQWAVEKTVEFGGFERLEWNEDSFFYPKTDFQELWESEGKLMFRLRCRKPLNDA
ncbi:MAG: tRNA (guanosine(46)-N7)-methyltransferase TrmB [Akkermansiaceae bacterium]|nr:tRNA (guanosine(46)-N7)-methyltransferase TrmB [Akkermansiaceae bacterium]